MQFRILLHDLNINRGEVLSSGHCEMIGVVEADDEYSAAEKLGLEVKYDNEGEEPNRYFSSVPDAEIELDCYNSMVIDAKALTKTVKDVMATREEVYRL